MALDIETVLSLFNDPNTVSCKDVISFFADCNNINNVIDMTTITKSEIIESIATVKQLAKNHKSWDKPIVELVAVNHNTLAERAGLSQIYRKIQNYDIGCITAYQSSDSKSSQRQIDIQNNTNKTNQNNLRAYLIKKGYSVVDIEGYYQELGIDKPSKESSLLVADVKQLGTLKSDLIKLGKKYNQDSIFYKQKNGPAELIATNPSVNDQVLGNGTFKATIGQAWSRIRGRNFVIEHFQPNLMFCDMTPTSKRTYSAMAKTTDV